MNRGRDNGHARDVRAARSARALARPRFTLWLNRGVGAIFLGFGAALLTLRRGLRRDDARHRAIARWTLPIWLFVSVTGVIVYLMLYWFPTT